MVADFQPSPSAVLLSYEQIVSHVQVFFFLGRAFLVTDDFGLALPSVSLVQSQIEVDPAGEVPAPSVSDGGHPVDQLTEGGK